MEYIGYITKKFEKVYEMYENAVDQNGALKIGDDSLFTDLVEKRERIICDIDMLDSLVSGDIQIQDDEETLKIKSEIMEKYHKIEELDADSQILAAKIRENIKAEIEKMNLGQRAINQGYQNKNKYISNGVYFDESIGSKKR